MTPPSQTESAFEASYSKMSVDALLRLASQQNSLNHAARRALTVELRKRRPDILALAVAEAILGTAIASATKIEQEFCAKVPQPQRFKDADFQDIVAEFAYLFLHLCDRDAFAAITEPQKRAAFLDSTFNQIFLFGTTLPMTEAHPIPAFTRREEKIEPGILVARNGMDDLNERQKEYAPLALFAAPDAPLARTVFWEFGGHTAKICDRYERLPSIQFDASLIACAAYKDLIPAITRMYEPPRKPVGFLRRLFRRRT